MPVMGDWSASGEDGPGVYRLVAVDPGGNPVAIRRVCGDDASGTLYMGQGGSVFGRIGLLRRTLRPDYKPGDHPAGIRYLRIGRLKTRLDLPFLATSCALSEPPDQAEGRLIESYVAEFGELPPLNRRHEGVPEA